jgi:CheY-like chemotaxis protein
VAGDATRLTQVVTNLLNNATKYTPEGGRIHVAVRREAGRALISMRDTGIGISAHLLGRIFDLFVQGERDVVGAQGGLGVGLALAKQLVEMHDGTIEAYSNGPGQGSEFVIRLPTLDAVAAREEPAASAPSSAAEAAVSRRVLVVDDNHDVADSTAMLLTYWGYKAIGAYDGPSALAAAAEFQPDVVLLDLDLPGMSGDEVSRRLRENAGRRCMVTVAITGYGQPKDFRRSREAGFEYHEVKPVDPARLKTLLATIVAENLRPF